MSSSTPAFARAAHLVCACALATFLGGCAVVSVASAVVGVAATGVGVAVDATVGAVKLTGKAVGAAADAVTPGGSSE
jgi:hypothetical protein